MTDKVIIAATNNMGKLAELTKILSSYGYTARSLAEAGINADPDETGVTFEENALIKAREIYNITKTPVISDDSGLEVSALDGAPGVYSARYAEPGKRRQKILDELKGLPYEKRGARFVCSICYIDENGNQKLFTGELKGKIGFESKGDNGFGYDSIFEAEPNITLAMLSDEDKNKISHRARALERLAEYLKDL